MHGHKNMFLLFVFASLTWACRTHSQESWIQSITLKGQDKASNFGIVDNATTPDGRILELLSEWLPNSATKAKGFNALVCQDPHGNPEWTLKAPVSNATPSLVALKNGDALVMSFYERTKGGTYPGLPSTILTEIDPTGTIVKENAVLYSGWIWENGTPAIVRADGDILLWSGTLLSDLHPDLSSFAWNEEIDQVSPPSGAYGGMITSVLENADGTLTLLGKYGALYNGSQRYYRYYFVHLDHDGNVLNYKTYDLNPVFYDAEVGSLVPIPGGGYWIAGLVEPLQLPNTLTWAYVVRLDEDGNIEWQETLCVDNYCVEGSVASAASLPDGNMVAVGEVGSGPPSGWPTGYIMEMDPGGAVQWLDLANDANAPAPYLSLPFLKVLLSNDGLIVPSIFSVAVAPNWVWRFRQDGSMDSSCAGDYLSPSVQTQQVDILTPCNDTMVATPYSKMVFNSGTTAAYKRVDVATFSPVCGDLYPGVLTGRVLQDPFRLKLTGWNFQDGTVGFINGVQVPSSTFKGTDATTGQTRMILGGGIRLKAMLPKGQAVTIIIQNPDGHQSVGFSFTR